MKKKSNYTNRRQQDLSKKQSKINGNSKGFAEIDRIEWLKQIYAEWLVKRNFILKYNKKTYLIYEPEEFDTEDFL
jgi:hypothetical protein